MIDKGELFAILKRRKKSELLEILDHAFDEMPPKTQRAVFLDLIQKSRPAKLDGPSLLEDVEDFHRKWMIPIDDKYWIPAYMKSLAATAKPGEFAAKALPVIRRDSGHSFCGAAYTSARKAANKQQLGELDAEIRARKVRTP